MALERYARKRRFDSTPEPAGGDFSAAGSRVFCVQRHHARRLHYDLRIEVGGTLKSWAVPQGPTLDPSVKRLAVMVEDHPLEYASFEGTIPKGNYGAGSMMLWDRGRVEVLGEMPAEDQLARGDFKFALHGEKVRGQFALVRMKTDKGNEWLLLKKKDEAAQAGWDIERHAWSVLTGRTQDEIAHNLPPRREVAAPPGAVEAPMPDTVAPMLASLAEQAPVSGGWIYEVKWDGVRALCHLRDGASRFFGRKG
jgi:bifunctional non-homologous end joining protein LigD